MTTVFPTRAAAVATATALLLAAIGCSQPETVEQKPAPQPQQQDPAGSEVPDQLQPQPTELASVPPDADDLDRFIADLDTEGSLVAHIETDHGTLDCELFEEKAPVTVANFVGLARGLKAYVHPATAEPISGVPFFDDVTFHRVIPEVLIQAGDPTGQGHATPGYTIPDEIVDELSHDAPGMLSMANRGPDTGGSQFFIIEGPQPHLDGHHTIFGQCEPKQVIRSISHVPTRAMSEPTEPAPTIKSITIRRF